MPSIHQKMHQSIEEMLEGENADEVIGRIISQVESHPRGITLEPDGSEVQVNKGYLVSLTNNSISYADASVVQAVLRQLQGNPFANYIGAWRSGETKRQYLDITMHLHCREDALKIARIYSQEAIYDCTRQKCLVVRI